MWGAVDKPINPMQQAISAGATFVARTTHTNPKHLLAMMEAAMRCNVKWYLYTSSVGGYHPAEVFIEDVVWKTFPSENDRHPGWAKRIGELQAEASFSLGILALWWTCEGIREG